MWVTGQMNSVKWYHDRGARCDGFKEDSVRAATCNSVFISTFASLCSVFQSQIARFCSLHTQTSLAIDISLRDESKPDSNSIDCFAVFYIFHAFSYRPTFCWKDLIFYEYWLIIGLSCLHRSCIYFMFFFFFI